MTQKWQDDTLRGVGRTGTVVPRTRSSSRPLPPMVIRSLCPTALGHRDFLLKGTKRSVHYRQPQGLPRHQQQQQLPPLLFSFLFGFCLHTLLYPVRLYWVTLIAGNREVIVSPRATYTGCSSGRARRPRGRSPWAIHKEWCRHRTNLWRRSLNIGCEINVPRHT